MSGWAAAGMAMGNIGSSAASFFAQQKMNREQRAWQERMSNTAHQREVADMKAAGLNPVLSAMGGGGATTPSGGTGSFAAGDITSAPTSLLLSKLRNENRIGRETAKQISAETDAIKADTALTRVTTSAQQIQRDRNWLNYILESKAAPRAVTEFETYGRLPDWLRTALGGMDMVSGTGLSRAVSAGSKLLRRGGSKSSSKK